MKAPIILTALLLLTGWLYAQTPITGTVKDGKGHPVRGASITIKDSYDGATADSLGNFHFQTEQKGNFILVMSEGALRKKRVAFYALFRVENGKVAEHWDTIQTIPEK